MSRIWVIDLGATGHVTGNKGVLFTLIAASFTPSIVLVDDSRTPVHSISTSCTTRILLLSSALYLPRFPFNLLP